MSRTTAQEYDVYVVRNAKSKPILVGKHVGRLPKTWVHEGTTYYFSYADMTQKWLSFTAVPPNFGKQ